MARARVRLRLPWLGLCALAVALAVLLARALWPAAAPPGTQLSRGTNAAWLGVEWVNEPHEEGEIAALAQDLARRQIRVVYVFTSYWKPGVGFNPSYAHAADFVRALKASTHQIAGPSETQRNAEGQSAAEITLGARTSPLCGPPPLCIPLRLPASSDGRTDAHYSAGVGPKAAQPGLSVQAWLGLPLKGESGVDLADATVRERTRSRS